VHAPGFYLHLAPADVFASGGIWHADTKAVTAIREAMVADADGWRAATSAIDLAAGNALKRVPAGFDKEHPLAEDLKRKDFAGIVRFGEQDATAPGFIDRYERVCESFSPLMRFLCGALRLVY